MADETAISASLRCSKNGAAISASASTTFDLSGTAMYQAVQNFPSSATAINIGECDECEQLFIKNLDAAISLTIGLDTPITEVVAVLKPGGCFLTSGISTTLYAKSASSTVDALVAVVES